MQPFKAKNLKGVLCKDIFGGFFLRVYKEDKTFKDYDIHLSDMEIEILDDDAYIYESDFGDSFIDYSLKTLGK